MVEEGQYPQPQLADHVRIRTSAATEAVARAAIWGFAAVGHFCVISFRPVCMRGMPATRHETRVL